MNLSKDRLCRVRSSWSLKRRFGLGTPMCFENPVIYHTHTYGMAFCVWELSGALIDIPMHDRQPWRIGANTAPERVCPIFLIMHFLDFQISR